MASVLPVVSMDLVDRFLRLRDSVYLSGALMNQAPESETQNVQPSTSQHRHALLQRGQ